MMLKLPTTRPVGLRSLTGLLAAGVLLTTYAAQGQALGNAPYSRLGLGEPAPGAGLTRNQGMAGVGVASPNSAYANEINPALSYYTRQVTFDVGLVGQVRNLKSGTSTQRTGNATLSYFALGVPIGKRWGATIGLRPIYTVDYQSRTTLGVPGDTAASTLVRYQGEGGMAQAYMAHSFRLFDGMTVGGEASYMFGSVESSTSSQLVSASEVTPVTERTVLLERRRYGDFLFRAGAHYRHAIGEKMNLGAGAAMQFGRDLTTTSDRRQERRSTTTNDEVLESIVLQDSVKGTVKLPYQFIGGVSIDNNRSRSLALDVQYQPWSQFRRDGAAQKALGDAWTVRLGGELTPDPNSVDSYFRRVTYRAGVSVGQTPYRDRSDKALREAAVSGGLALPLGKVVGFESGLVQLAATYGLRSSGTTNSLREQFVRVNLGIALSSTWFVKRRIE